MQADDFNSSTETTTENVDRLSAVIESTTSYPTVSYSIKSIKLINEENEYYGGIFVLLFLIH